LGETYFSPVKANIVTDRELGPGVQGLGLFKKVVKKANKRVKYHRKWPKMAA